MTVQLLVLHVGEVVRFILEDIIAVFQLKMIVTVNLTILYLYFVLLPFLEQMVF